MAPSTKPDATPETTAARPVRPPVAQVLRELDWLWLLGVGLATGIAWVLLLIQGGAAQFMAGLLPVTGGIIVGQRIKGRHITWHAVLLSLITSAAAFVTAVIALNLVQGIPAIVQQSLLTGFFLLLMFPAFGVITASRSAQRARDARNELVDRGGKLERPGRVKTLEDIRALSLPQLGSFVADLFRTHGFLVKDYRFQNKEGAVDLMLTKDDEPWLVRVVVDEKVRQGVVLQYHQMVKEQGGTKAVMVTSMDFQDQAQRWATSKPLVLIDGPTLLSMMD